MWNKFFPSIRGGHCVLSYVTRGRREDITPRITIDNTFIGRNVYTTAKQGAKATLVYLLSVLMSLLLCILRL
jgi:hypothetical protein